MSTTQTKQTSLVNIIRKLDSLPKARLPLRQASDIARNLILSTALAEDLKVNDALALVTQVLQDYHDSLLPFTASQK